MAAMTACVLTVAAYGSSTGFAREGQATQFRTGVEGVMLDVSVLDSRGRPVTGLTRNDFVVLEDGVPQTLQSLQEISTAGGIDSMGSQPDQLRDVWQNDQPSKGRLVVLVMDDESGVDPLLAAGVVAHAKAVARMVLDQLAPADLAAVVYPSRSDPSQELTRDADRLTAAIDRYLPDSSRNPHRWRQYQSVLETLRLVVESLSAESGLRKAVFFLSPGIPLDFAQVGPIWPEPGRVDEAGQVRDLVQQLRQVFTVAQLANVNIHSVDLYGLPAVAGAGNPYRPNREFLQTVSENTGGIAIVDTNDPTSMVSRAMASTSAYYLLGYQPLKQGMAGRFRKVDVRVSRPNVRVYTRKGYFERKPDKTAASPGPMAKSGALDRALAGLLPATDIPLRVAVAPVGPAGTKATALLAVMHVAHPSPASRVTDELAIASRVISRTGTVVASTNQTARLVLKPGSAPTVQYELLARLDVPPGRYTARFAVYNSRLGKSGSVYCEVDVPDFRDAALSLSGILLGAEPGIPAAPRDAIAGLVPVVPTASREFRQGQTLSAFVRLHQGASGSLSAVDVSVRVTDAAGTSVFEAADVFPSDRFVATRSVEHRVALPIAALDPGAYTLTIQAATRHSTARRSLRFDIADDFRSVGSR